MEAVKHYVVRNYHQDPVLFFIEMFSVCMQLAASLYLAVTAKDPDLLTVYAMYTVGSGVGIYVYYKRQLVWTLVMVVVYTMINVLGLYVMLS